VSAPSLRERTAAGDVLLGTALSLPGAVVAELVAEPWDFVWIDLEHAALSVADAQALAVGARAGGAAALVRIPRADDPRLAAILDTGVEGIVLPSASDPAEVAQLGARLRHPPDGLRGYGPRRSGWIERSTGGPGTPVLWAQVEAPLGPRLAELAAVEAVDALVVGTADLSWTLLGRLDPTAAPVLEAIREAGAAAASARKAFGVAGALTSELVTAVKAVAPATTIWQHGVDGRLLAAAVDAAAARLRAATGPHAMQEVLA